MTREIEILKIDLDGYGTYRVKFIREGEVRGWYVHGCRDEMEAYKRAISGEWNTGTRHEAPPSGEFEYEGVGWPWKEWTNEKE